VARLISEPDIGKIIVEGNVMALVREAERFGQELATDQLTKSQIRAVFGTVRQIEAAWDLGATDAAPHLRRVLLLQPRLAYQSRRQEKVRPLGDVLQAAIRHIGAGTTAEEQRRRFGHFVDLFEAILAYHTAYGGK